MSDHRDQHPDPDAHERLVHGLLSTMSIGHAAAQDRRVRAAMARIDAQRGGIIARIGRFGVTRVAAAGALAATLTIAVILTFGSTANSAYATLQSISNRLATGNRSYRQTIVLSDRNGTESLREATVDVGTGRRFVFAIDLSAMPRGPMGRPDFGGRGMPGQPGSRPGRGPDGIDGPGRDGPGRGEPGRPGRGPDGIDGPGRGERGRGEQVPPGPERCGPEGPQVRGHHGAPPVAWGYDGTEYWQIDLEGSITRSDEPMRMRDPMPLMGGAPSDPDEDDADEELLTLQPLLDRLAGEFDLSVVAGSQSRGADGSPLVVIEARLRPGARAAASAPTDRALHNARRPEGPSIRSGRLGMRGPPLPERVRLVADAQTNELVSVTADWPEGSRHIRRMVLEQVEARAADDGWFLPERHLTEPGGPGGAGGAG